MIFREGTSIASIGTLALASGLTLGGSSSLSETTMPPRGPSEDPAITIDLDIYDGQRGREVPEAEEYDVGAFTVANLNDTDGDGVVDKNDRVVSATPRGRDEVDLMKLALHKPSRLVSGESVHLTVTSGQDIRLWKSPTKKKLITSRKFKASELPKEFWVEATAPSKELRDILIEAEYGDASDSVRATSVWVDEPVFRNTGTELSPDADGAELVSTFDEFGGRLGTGFAGPSTPTYGMELGFSVRPPGIGKESSVVFDITRQREWSGWLFEDGEVIFARIPGFDRPEFPKHCEEPNDDASTRDEDVEPTNDHIYTVDFPRVDITETGADRLVLFFNFNEFVRVKLTGEGFINSNGLVEGSRASEVFPWRCRMDLIKDEKSKKWLENPATAGSNEIVKGHKGLELP